MTAHVSLQDGAKTDAASSAPRLFYLLLIYLFCSLTHPNRQAWEAENAARGGTGDTSTQLSNGGYPCRDSTGWCHSPRDAHPKSGSAHLHRSAGRSPSTCAGCWGWCRQRPGRPGGTWPPQVSQSTPGQEGKRDPESVRVKYSLSDPTSAIGRERGNIGREQERGEGTGDCRCAGQHMSGKRRGKAVRTTLSLPVPLLLFTSLPHAYQSCLATNSWHLLSFHICCS